VLFSATRLWELIRRSRTQFRDRPKNVRLHPGFDVHVHPGSLFGIIPESRSRSPGIPTVSQPPASQTIRRLIRCIASNVTAVATAVGNAPLVKAPVGVDQLGMASKKIRPRAVRTPCNLPATITWTEEGNRDRYILGTCVEISTTGLRIELPQPIPYLTYVTLRIEGLALAVSGRVRHSRASGLKCTTGLELSQPIRAQIMEALRTGQKVENSKRWQD